VSHLEEPGRRSSNPDGGARLTSGQRDVSVLDVPDNLTRMNDQELERWLGAVLERYGMSPERSPGQTAH